MERWQIDGLRSLRNLRKLRNKAKPQGVAAFGEIATSRASGAGFYPLPGGVAHKRAWSPSAPAICAQNLSRLTAKEAKPSPCPTSSFCRQSPPGPPVALKPIAQRLVSKHKAAFSGQTDTPVAFAWSPKATTGLCLTPRDQSPSSGL